MHSRNPISNLVPAHGAIEIAIFLNTAQSGQPLIRLLSTGRSWLKLAHDGLEREFSFFNYLEGGVCTMSAPRNQKKSRDRQCQPASNSTMPMLRCVVDSFAARAFSCSTIENCRSKSCVEGSIRGRVVTERPLLAQSGRSCARLQP